jgi:hypothetical protein
MNCMKNFAPLLFGQSRSVGIQMLYIASDVRVVKTPKGLTPTPKGLKDLRVSISMWGN